MKKVIRCLLLSSFLLLVLATASAQGKHKPKSEKFGRKVSKEKKAQSNHMADKDQIEKHKQKTNKEKHKAHEKKLNANKAYRQAEKQKRKERAKDVE